MVIWSQVLKLNKPMTVISTKPELMKTGNFMKNTIFNSIRENRVFFIFIFLMVIFRTSFADWNTVPTGSMKPTILEGDRIWVNKLAYDLNIPFTNTSVKKFSDPKRDDIIIFDSEKADKRLVKRVIGVPGDTISMVNNIIYLNGKALEYKIINQHQDHIIVEEKLTIPSHKLRLERPIQNRVTQIFPLTVPDNSYLVLGDNRNNSADSRFIGFVPRKEILGRARYVVMSLDYKNNYLPRTSRFFHRL